jgi:hypothetical protein
MSVETESDFFLALLAYLNRNMCPKNLPSCPDLARDTERQAVSVSLMMVGGSSYATRLTGLDDGANQSFTQSGRRARRTAAKCLENDLMEAKSGFPPDMVAVLQLFDNVAY